MLITFLLRSHQQINDKPHNLLRRTPEIGDSKRHSRNIHWRRTSERLQTWLKEILQHDSKNPIVKSWWEGHYLEAFVKTSTLLQLLHIVVVIVFLLLPCFSLLADPGWVFSNGRRTPCNRHHSKFPDLNSPTQMLAMAGELCFQHRLKQAGQDTGNVLHVRWLIRHFGGFGRKTNMAECAAQGCQPTQSAELDERTILTLFQRFASGHCIVCVSSKALHCCDSILM